jgi:hypothetical protein
MAERKKLLLRLDPEVYDAVARWAADDIRSVNAQIEFALRSALRTAGRLPGGRRAAVDDGATAAGSITEGGGGGTEGGSGGTEGGGVSEGGGGLGGDPADHSA